MYNVDSLNTSEDISIVVGCYKYKILKGQYLVECSIIVFEYKYIRAHLVISEGKSKGDKLFYC